MEEPSTCQASNSHKKNKLKKKKRPKITTKTNQQQRKNKGAYLMILDLRREMKRTLGRHADHQMLYWGKGKDTGLGKNKESRTALHAL